MTNGHFLVLSARHTHFTCQQGVEDSDSGRTYCLQRSQQWLRCGYRLDIIRSKGTAQPLLASFPQANWGPLSLVLSSHPSARIAGGLSGKSKTLPLSQLRDELRPVDVVRVQRVFLQARETDV